MSNKALRLIEDCRKNGFVNTMYRHIERDGVYDDVTMKDLALFRIADVLSEIKQELKELKEVEKKVRRF